MILLSAALAVLAMVAVGMVMFHVLARLLSADGVPAGDFLLLAPLPGLALVGLLLTALGALHLLYGWVLLVMAAGLLWLFRRDVAAVMAAVRQAGLAIEMCARFGDLFPLLAVIAFIAVGGLGLTLALVPGHNVDIWVFHVPLARSIVAHHGLVYPQIDHLFYGNQPLLFELMAATVMLAADHFAAAGAINLAIYLGLLLLLLSFARRARGALFLFLCLLLVWQGPFFVQAVQPMIDVPRSCFSVGAYLFAFRYLRDFNRLDLASCGLLAGAAVAGKYTELLTPVLIGLTLLPFFLRRPALWPHLVPALLLFAGLSCLWYLKNLFLYGNPVYPFLLGHPGLSEAWMSGYMAEITSSPLASDQGLSHDLLTSRGWHDLALAWCSKFRGLVPVAGLAVAGLFLPLARRWLLPFWSLVLFLVWYVLMFNARRWAIPASLTLIAAAFLVICWFIARGLEIWERRVPISLQKRGAAVASGVAAILFLAAAVLSVLGHGQILLPRWKPSGDSVVLAAPCRACDDGAGIVRHAVRSGKS